MQVNGKEIDKTIKEKVNILNELNRILEYSFF